MREYKKLKFFETKVVRVKKEICHHNEVICKNGNFKCRYCGRYLERDWEKAADGIKRWGWKMDKSQQKEGNYVNGENIDKIEFPCFCSFSHPRLKDLRYGIITNTGYHCGYALIDVGSQSLGVHLMNTQPYLDKLIKEWDIHILKGKIIILEEEEEK